MSERAKLIARQAVGSSLVSYCGGRSWACRWSNQDVLELADAYLAHPYGELKPLEWTQLGPRCFAANAYYVQNFGVGWHWYISGEDGDELQGRCESVDHGKKLCQADYERRVAALFKPIGGAE